MVCLLIPVIACVLHRSKVFNSGLKSLFFIAYRNILFVFGLAFIGLGYMQTQSPEMSRPLLEEELKAINSMPAPFKDIFLSLSPAEMVTLIGGLMIIPALAMWFYGRSVAKRYGQATYDRDVAVVRDGINQSRL